MRPATRYCHCAVAKRSAVETVASFRRDKSLAAVCLVFLWHLFVSWDSTLLALSFVGATVQEPATRSSVTSPSTASLAKDRRKTPYKQIANPLATAQNGAYLHPISYADCRAPLVVGGEIVGCEGGTASRNSVPYSGGSSGDPLGPLLNQSISVEIDGFPGGSPWSQPAKRIESSLAAEIAGENAGERVAENLAPNNTRNEAKKVVSENPQFIRIFGRWTPFGEVHLWVDADVNPDPLRRLAGEAALLSQRDRRSGSSYLPGQDSAAPGVTASADSKSRYPFLYWRQSTFSLSVQNSCIAFIKLPAKQEESSPIPASPRTAHIPDSCGEAQQLLLSRELSSEPFWLSCGPQLELSKLAHFITFSVSQEKINKVLAALEYSVEIWSEPHEFATVGSPKNPTEEFQKPVQGSSLHQSDVEAPQKQVVSGSAGAQPKAHPARGVEARRLAAEHGEHLSEPPKWRVGICLLNGPQERVIDRISEEREMEHQSAAEKAVNSSAQGGFGTVDEGLEQVTGSAKVEQTGDATEPSYLQNPIEDTEAKLVGEIKFHVRPEVASHAEDDDKHEDPETIQIRHFIDAGWVYTREVRGVNLTRFNRLALKETREGATRPCLGFWEEHSLLSVAPESYAWDETTREETLRFVFSSSLKGLVGSRDALYNSVPGRHATSRMHICFYSNDEQPYGLFLGEVQFIIDSADATLLVFFILFVFLAIPVMCAVAISFHVYKHRHLRERLQRLVLVQQRDAVEQLLMRELGLTREDPDDADDDDDEEELHT